MNKEQVLAWAWEAGFPLLGPERTKAAERFAALVAAAERERIKAQNAPEIERVNQHIKALENAVKTEREACAKVCELMIVETLDDNEWVDATNDSKQRCANAIRARSTK